MNPVSDITTESVREEEHKMDIFLIATTCVAGIFVERWTRDDSLDPGWSKVVGSSTSLTRQQQSCSLCITDPGSPVSLEVELHGSGGGTPEVNHRLQPEILTFTHFWWSVPASAEMRRKSKSPRLWRLEPNRPN